MLIRPRIQTYCTIAQPGHADNGHRVTINGHRVYLDNSAFELDLYLACETEGLPYDQGFITTNFLEKI